MPRLSDVPPACAHGILPLPTLPPPAPGSTGTSAGTGPTLSHCSVRKSTPVCEEVMLVAHAASPRRMVTTLSREHVVGGVLAVQPPAFGPVLHLGTVKGGKYIAVRKSLNETSRSHRTRKTFPRRTATGQPARSQCRATGLLLPAPRPPRPSLPFYLSPHAPARAPRSRPTLALLALYAHCPDRCVVFPCAITAPHGYSREPELAVASVLAGGPIPWGRPPSVMMRAANDRHFGSLSG